MSQENGNVPNTNNNNDLDVGNILNTIVSLLCGLCNKDNSVQEMFGLDDQNNTTQRLYDPNRNDDYNSPGEQLLRTIETTIYKNIYIWNIVFFYKT